MKIYKKLQKAFSGSGLYFDKVMKNHLQVFNGDELVIELQEVDGQPQLIITKSKLNNTKISEVLEKYLNAKTN